MLWEFKGLFSYLCHLVNSNRSRGCESLSSKCLLSTVPPNKPLPSEVSTHVFWSTHYLLILTNKSENFQVLGHSWIEKKSYNMIQNQACPRMYPAKESSWCISMKPYLTPDSPVGVFRQISLVWLLWKPAVKHDSNTTVESLHKVGFPATWWFISQPGWLVCLM